MYDASRDNHPLRCYDFSGTEFALVYALQPSRVPIILNRGDHIMPTNESITREKLIQLLNEDLSREYQAIIAYVVYSQVLKGAQYMSIADELAVHAGEELQHALTLSNQIDYLGGMPTVTPKAVKTSDKATDMLQFDLDNENETIRNYRIRVRQCEQLGEYAIAEHIREILVQEQDHQIALATALGKDVPDVSTPDEMA